MGRVESLYLPFAPDDAQVALMREAVKLGDLIASRGTDRFELLAPLVDAGLVLRYEWSGDMFSHQVSRAGRRALESATFAALGEWMVGDGPCPI